MASGSRLITAMERQKVTMGSTMRSMSFSRPTARPRGMAVTQASANPITMRVNVASMCTQTVMLFGNPTVRSCQNVSTSFDGRENRYTLR